MALNEHFEQHKDVKRPVLRGDLGPRALVRSIRETQGLGVSGKAAADRLPIDALEHALPLCGEVDNLIVDEVDLGINISRQHLSEIADLGDRAAICQKPKNVAIAGAPLLPADS